MAHAALTITIINSMKKMNDCLKEDLRMEQNHRVKLSQKAQECCSKTKTMSTEITSLQKRLSHKETELTTLVEKCSNAVQRIEEDQQVIETFIGASSVRDIEAKIAYIASKKKELSSLINKLTCTGSAAGPQDSEEVGTNWIFIELFV